MKRLLIAATLLAFALAAHASPGRTNGKGCHKPKRGSYHCHTSKTTTVKRAPGVAPAPKPVKPAKPAKRAA